MLPPDELREQIKQNLDPRLFHQLEVQLTRLSTWQTQWPPADCIDGYSADERAMIMAAVKARTEAGIEIERESARRSQNRQDRGQIFGFTIAAGSLVLGGVLGVVGNTWAAASIAIVGLLVGVGGPSVARLIADRYYLKGMARQQRRERE